MSKTLALELDVYHKLFAGVTEEMGIVLRRSAFSANIKERRDYSCALGNGRGELLAQAAHIPVHLGALPRSMATVLAREGPLAPGEVILLNDPYLGGTHLPDLTVMAPCYAPGGGEPVFYVVNRAHHADVGGASPGSMALTDDIRREGVIIPPIRIMRQGVMDEAVVQELLGRMRMPEERRGDLAAQIAALTRGQVRLAALMGQYGVGKLARMGEALLDYAERAMRALIRSMPPGVYRYQDYLDDDGYGRTDLLLDLILTMAGEEVELDFRGSADQTRGGVNTVPAVVEAACYYVFLALLPDVYPINQGCFRPLTVLTRPGSLLEARFPAPVAAGNVETSQRVVDVVLGALAQALPGRIPAASQGTMNNVAFGGMWPESGEGFTYYETLAGGMGGGPDGPGQHGVHTHMTNTRNTPVEVLEHTLPVRVEYYGLRPESGGRGYHPGGMGIRRDLRFLTPVSLSLLSERRRRGPYGLAGGRPGAAGENRVQRPGGPEEVVAGKVNVTLPAGSVVSIRTPGGGGWGEDKGKNEA